MVGFRIRFHQIKELIEPITKMSGFALYDKK